MYEKKSKEVERELEEARKVVELHKRTKEEEDARHKQVRARVRRGPLRATA